MMLMGMMKSGLRGDGSQGFVQFQQFVIVWFYDDSRIIRDLFSVIVCQEVLLIVSFFFWKFFVWYIFFLAFVMRRCVEAQEQVSQRNTWSLGVGVCFCVFYRDFIMSQGYVIISSFFCRLSFSTKGIFFIQVMIVLVFIVICEYCKFKYVFINKLRRKLFFFFGFLNRDVFGKVIILWNNFSKIQNFKICFGKIGFCGNNGLKKREIQGSFFLLEYFG